MSLLIHVNDGILMPAKPHPVSSLLAYRQRVSFAPRARFNSQQEGSQRAPSPSREGDIEEDLLIQVVSLDILDSPSGREQSYSSRRKNAAKLGQLRVQERTSGLKAWRCSSKVGKEAQRQLGGLALGLNRFQSDPSQSIEPRGTPADWILIKRLRSKSCCYACVRKDRSGAELLGESLEDVAEDKHTQDVFFPELAKPSLPLELCTRNGMCSVVAIQMVDGSVQWQGAYGR
ncbi:hypothetical protein EDD85DRAFT_938372 [Armillaria nabsnona]|nr:hypothetical protein EDD85DRAFT_938372 [Armillaria nabsnona]